MVSYTSPASIGMIMWVLHFIVLIQYITLTFVCCTNLAFMGMKVQAYGHFYILLDLIN